MVFHAFSRVHFLASLGQKSRCHQGQKAEMEGGLAPVSFPSLRSGKETGGGS